MTSKNDDASTLEQPTETALTTSKNEYKIDSIFALLSPWEQHVLALFYEQDDVRSTIRQVCTSSTGFSVLETNSVRLKPL